MQGLADGYFVLPYTIGDYLADEIRTGQISTDTIEFEQAENQVKATLDKLINTNGDIPVDDFHRRLGLIMWEYCGMSRNEKGLKKAIILIKKLRDEFYSNLYVPGDVNDFNPELEKAYRVADFLELGELMCIDALNRKESCGGHFREESQTDEGEALRDDDNYTYVSAWEYRGDPSDPKLHKELLKYDNIEVKQEAINKNAIYSQGLASEVSKF